MKNTFQRRVLLAVALCIGVSASQIAFTPTLFAQNGVSGDISGTVTDPTGATLPGANGDSSPQSQRRPTIRGFLGGLSLDNREELFVAPAL